MKKTYIAPENTVVCIKMETMIAQSAPQPKYNPDQTTEATSGNLSREVIETPDAWEEW